MFCGTCVYAGKFQLLRNCPENCVLEATAAGNARIYKDGTDILEILQFNFKNSF